jgi:3-vinyl bacteriochlorophyllide hydratase
MGVIALHTVYLVSWFFDLAAPEAQLWLALAAYAAYVVNAIQFLIKFQTARRSAQSGSKTFVGDY